MGMGAQAKPNVLLRTWDPIPLLTSPLKGEEPHS